MADRYRYTAAGILVATLLVAIPAGCQPVAVSPVTGKKSSESKLVADAEAYVARTNATLATLEAEFKAKTLATQADAEAIAAAFESAFSEIDQQKQILHQSLEVIAASASAAAPGSAPLIASALGIGGLMIGIGTTADNRRKDAVIEQMRPKRV